MACQMNKVIEYMLTNKPNWVITKQLKEILDTENEVKEDGNSIYTKLGDKTEVGNVKIVKNIFANKYDKNIITAFRVDKKMGLLESFNKYNAIGNPIDWQKFEPRFKNDNATKAFIDWFLGNDYKELEQDYRQALLNSLDALKGKKIEYYKELGRPSHATALDYLVNTKVTLNEGKADTQEEVGKIDSVQSVEDKTVSNVIEDSTKTNIINAPKEVSKQANTIIDSIKYVETALKGSLDAKSRESLSKITDKNVLDKIIENIKCTKGL